MIILKNNSCVILKVFGDMNRRFGLFLNIGGGHVESVGAERMLDTY